MTPQIEIDYIFFGYGKVTSRLMQQLHSNGKSVACITKQNHTPSSNQKITFIDSSEVDKFYVDSKIAIFGWKEINTINSRSLEWVSSNHFSAKKSFLLSSASLYRDSVLPVSENNSNLDENYLENNKYILERILVDILKNKTTSHTNLRISNIYGVNLDYGFIANLVNSIRYQTPAVIFNETFITRDYLFIDDLGIAINRLSRLDTLEENLNVGSGIGISLSHILMLFEKLGFQFGNANYIDAPENIKQSVILDCTKLGNLIEWSPRKFDAEIKTILQSVKGSS